jgi:hypothetical protein
VYAYALEAVEQEARAYGGSIIEARDEFHKRFSEEPTVETAEREPPVKVREERQAQADLLAAMGRAARA